MLWRKYQFYSLKINTYSPPNTIYGSNINTSSMIMIDHHLIVEMNTQTQQSSFFLWVCSTHFFHSLHEQRNQERILIIIADWIPAVWHFLQWTIIELTVGLNLKICKKKIIFLNISLLFTFNLCNRTIPEIFFFFFFYFYSSEVCIRPSSSKYVVSSISLFVSTQND